MVLILEGFSNYAGIILHSMQIIPVVLLYKHFVNTKPGSKKCNGIDWYTLMEQSGILVPTDKCY